MAAVILSALSSCRKEDEPVLPEDEGEVLTETQILALVRKDVVNTAYYKDLFLDGGCELNPGIKENGTVINGKLPYAMKKTGITNAEYFLSTVNDVGNGYTESDKELQTAIISGTEQDINGVLLYPDGEPRFRMIYVFGGHSNPHGQTLGEPGRKNVHTFYTNGGSYVGSCAGAYLAGKYASGGVRNYFNIWKNGNMIATGVSSSSIDIEFSSNIFEKYYGPAEGSTVTDVRHNGGGFMDVDGAPEGTEVIALFRKERGKTNTKVSFYGQPGIWAYKASDESGRLVVTGSHPEDAASGDILNLTSSMFKYAWDGSGIATVKAVLSNGDMIPMTKGTQDNMPQYTAIGDRQCHHFVFWLPKDTNSVSLDIQAADEYDMELYLKKDDFAFPDNTPDYSSAVGGGLQSIKAGPLEKGLWYVTVRCASTVTATEVITDKTNGLGRRFVYSGNTGVLNGVPYTISLNWK